MFLLTDYVCHILCLYFTLPGMWEENTGYSTISQLLIFVEPKRDVSSVNCAEECAFPLFSAYE